MPTTLCQSKVQSGLKPADTASLSLLHSRSSTQKLLTAKVKHPTGAKARANQVTRAVLFEYHVDSHTITHEMEGKNRSQIFLYKVLPSITRFENSANLGKRPPFRSDFKIRKAKVNLPLRWCSIIPTASH